MSTRRQFLQTTAAAGMGFFWPERLKPPWTPESAPSPSMPSKSAQ